MAQGLARYTEAWSIFQALEKIESGYHPVRLLRMSWLLEQSNHALCRRQDLPEEAFVPVKELKQIWEDSENGGRDAVLPVITISFCWDEPWHPDPTAKQLNLIIRTLRREVRKYRDSFGSFRGFRDMGIFWDWGSLMQVDQKKFDAAKAKALAEGKSAEEADKAASAAGRTPAEKAAFKYGLHETMDLWYAHQGTTVFLLTEHASKRGSARKTGYHESGWTTFEKCSAEQIKKVHREHAIWDAVLDLGEADGEARAAGRHWPMGPDDFDRRIEKTKFTNSSNMDDVKKLYRKMSLAQLGGIVDLDLAGLPKPTMQDASQLGGCLTMCESLTMLTMNNVGLEDEAAKAMFERLENDSLPSLEVLDLRQNNISDSAMKAMADAAIRGAFKTVREIYLSLNQIGDVGIQAFASAARQQAYPSLKQLWVDDNNIRDSGAQAVSQAILMRKLPRYGHGGTDLTGNPIGEEIMKTLQKANFKAEKKRGPHAPPRDKTCHCVVS